MIRLLAAAIVLFGVHAGAHAQGLDMSKGGPIEVTARDGIEWRQNEQVVIARGDARAVRGDVTVMADTLIAHYRRKANQPSATKVSTGPSTGPSTGSVISGGDTGANEIYRLEADGHVKIFNATDIAVGDHAIYDIDQAVLVMTGKDMSLTTPNHVMTARDTMEWWSQKHMAVGRGLATVTTSDGKRLAADVLVGYTSPDQQGTAQPPSTTGSSSAAAAAGKLEKVEAFGHVEVRTATETITGDRGVYVAASDISRLVGHVHITRGMNQLNGDEALINMKTGISTLVRDPGARVQGLVVPNDSSTPGPATGAPKRKPAKP